MGQIRVTRTSQPQTPTRINKRAIWAFLPITTSSNYISFEGGLIKMGAVASPAPSTAIGTGKTGPLRGIKPAATGSLNASVSIPVGRLNAAFAATGAASVLIVCKSQSSAGHGSSIPAIFELQTSGSFNHYPFTDGNIYVGPLSATRYLNGTVSGATAGIYDPHVAIATAKSGTQRFYVNGILRGSGSAVETPAISNAGSAGFGEFGSIYLAVFFDYVLSASEVKSFTANPWQVFAPMQDFGFAPSVAGGVTGTVAYANADDTSAASGTTTVVGSLAKTNDNDTSAASGTTTILGTLARTNANDTSAASGTTTVVGTLATTNANDTCAASGTVGTSGSTGTLATTNANDTVSAAGTTTVTGTLARTNANDTVSAAGWVGAITGTLAYTNESDTSSATGTVTGGATQAGGGWMPPQGRRKTRKEVYAERVKMGILPPAIVRAAEKVAVVAETVAEFKADRPRYEEMFMRELSITKWSPDYTRAIQAQIEILEQEDEDILLLM